MGGFVWFWFVFFFFHGGCCTSFIGKINMKPHKRWNMLFLLKNFHWTLMVSIQSLTYKLLQADVHTCARGRRWQRPGVRDGFCAMHWEPTIHLPAFWAFWADLVTFPAPPLFFSTFLMTPTATVCRMSRTAKRPEGQGEGQWQWDRGLSSSGRVVVGSTPPTHGAMHYPCPWSRFLQGQALSYQPLLVLMLPSILITDFLT